MQRLQGNKGGAVVAWAAAAAAAEGVWMLTGQHPACGQTSTQARKPSLLAHVAPRLADRRAGCPALKEAAEGQRHLLAGFRGEYVLKHGVQRVRGQVAEIKGWAALQICLHCCCALVGLRSG